MEATNTGIYDSINLLSACTKKGYVGIEFGSGIKSIADYAFYGDMIFTAGSPIRTIFMSSVSRIGKRALSGSASLTSISIPPSGLTLSATTTAPAIGSLAFEGCTRFTGFTGGPLKIVNTTNESVEDQPIPSIGSAAFIQCPLTIDFIKRIDLTGIGGSGSNAIPLSLQGDGTNYSYIAPTSGFTLGITPMSSDNSGCLFAGAIPSLISET
ncbi:hypothetical protein FACS1894166_05490 [Bacilli bacterium]|nr:hypothetical protein FACS1894166_05490 [Bacilli bacterium]